MTIQINSQFDGGNIEVVECHDGAPVKLAIRHDTSSEFYQWFYFSVSGISGQKCRFEIVNAGQSSYAKGWEGYDVVTSQDRHYWYRTPCKYDGSVLSWELNTDVDIVWFAYFAPYTLDQHADLISAAACARGVKYQSLGLTHQGRHLDYLQVSALPTESMNDPVNQARSQLWVIARQHPGEPMAEWWMEGFLDRLLDEDDATSRALRQLADVHVVPNMNPDGSFLGNLRTNSIGVNLNREWDTPSMERSPEVFQVKQKMIETGIDLALDVHGDEALPYNFIAGTEGLSNWDEEKDARLIAFKQTWSALNPDFQTAHGYPRTPRGKANMSVCSSQLAQSFNCLAMTLEMPFKDTADTPRPHTGWSPERSMRLGASFVDMAYLALTDKLLS
ncbi:MAG: M14-type cytosolic carboxypeptidase [Granulosicoccus sp.]